MPSSYNKRYQAQRKSRKKEKSRANNKRRSKNILDKTLAEVRQIVLDHAATYDLVSKLPTSSAEARAKWAEAAGQRSNRRSVWVNSQAGAPGLGKRK
jgi:hypothetical protein